MIKAIILEDEPHVRRELSLLTPWEELGVVFAGEGATGFEGIKLIEHISPQIVITDIRMPKMNGLELIEYLRSKNIEEKNGMFPEFIILSGYSEFEYARKAMQMGVQEYLLKPVEDNDLKEAILRSKKRAEEKKTLLSGNAEKRLEAVTAFFTEYTGSGSAASRYASGAVELMQNRYIQGITIEEAAAALGISAGYLSRIFRQETGYTFVDYLMYIRVKNAAFLLRDSDIKIYEAADLVGYTDARYFSQIFRRVTGLTPREYKDGL